MNRTQLSPDCKLVGNISTECYRAMITFVSQINNDVWIMYKNSKEHKRGADLYIIAILGIFGSVIVCLLFRSMRKENLDDQVVLMLSSMQIHVDFEERQRQRKRLKEEKGKAQAWLTQIGLRGIRKFRGRSSSYHAAPKERTSVCSVPTKLRSSPLCVKPPSRARSYQGFLPEIVVTDHNQHNPHCARLSAPNSRPSSQLSRMSSGMSYRSETFSFEEAEHEEDVFTNEHVGNYP